MLRSIGWTIDAIGASEPVYLKPVASATDAYYELTFEQLRLLAEADELRLRIDQGMSHTDIDAVPVGEALTSQLKE